MAQQRTIDGGPQFYPCSSDTTLVYAVDRRGRGGSGDAEPYAIEQEFDDIVAVINSIDEPVFLLGTPMGRFVPLRPHGWHSECEETRSV